MNPTDQTLDTDLDAEVGEEHEAPAPPVVTIDADGQPGIPWADQDDNYRAAYIATQTKLAGQRNEPVWIDDDGHEHETFNPAAWPGSASDPLETEDEAAARAAADAASAAADVAAEAAAFAESFEGRIAAAVADGILDQDQADALLNTTPAGAPGEGAAFLDGEVVQTVQQAAMFADSHPGRSYTNAEARHINAILGVPRIDPAFDLEAEVAAGRVKIGDRLPDGRLYGGGSSQG